MLFKQEGGHLPGKFVTAYSSGGWETNCLIDLFLLKLRILFIHRNERKRKEKCPQTRFYDEEMSPFFKGMLLIVNCGSKYLSRFCELIWFFSWSWVCFFFYFQNVYIFGYNVHFLKNTGSYPYLETFILIGTKIWQQIY